MSSTPFLAIALAVTILIPASANALCVNPEHGSIEVRNGVVAKGIAVPSLPSGSCPRGSTEVLAPRIATGRTEFEMPRTPTVSGTTRTRDGTITNSPGSIIGNGRTSRVTREYEVDDE